MRKACPRFPVPGPARRAGRQSACRRSVSTGHCTRADEGRGAYGARGPDMARDYGRSRVEDGRSAHSDVVCTECNSTATPIDPRTLSRAQRNPCKPVPLSVATVTGSVAVLFGGCRTWASAASPGSGLWKRLLKLSVGGQAPVPGPRGRGQQAPLVALHALAICLVATGSATGHAVATTPLCPPPASSECSSRPARVAALMQRTHTRAHEHRGQHRDWSRDRLGTRHSRQRDHRCPLCT
jgi:hypothetical protein